MTRVIAWYEFLFTVKRPAYLIVTFGLPVFIGMYAGFIMLVTAGTAKYAIEGLSAKIGVVDKSGLLEYAKEFEAAQADKATDEPTVPAEFEAAAKKLESMFENIKPDESKSFDSLADARASLDQGDIDIIVVVPTGFLDSGEMDCYTREWKLFSAIGAPKQVQSRLRLGVMQRAGLSDSELALIRDRESPGGFRAIAMHEIGPNGEFVEVDVLSRTLSLALPAGIAGILIMALLINAGFLLAGVAEEKENKVIEVLLSMVRVEELLMGKVLGLSAAALLQMFVWVAMTAPIPLITLALAGQHFQLGWNPAGLFISAAFFLLGFVFYGALLVGLGSLGNNVKESQQYSVYIMLLPVVPLVLSMVLLNVPNSGLARALGWIPFFSAPAMMIRVATGEVPWWDIALAALILAASTWAAVRFSARLFRVGVLMRGQTMNPIKIARLFFQA